MRLLCCLVTAFVVVLPISDRSQFARAQTTAAPQSRPATPATPSRDQRPASQTVGTGAIHGRIVDGENERPLRRARITLSSPALARPRMTSTNADGRYEFKDLLPGRYTLSVARSGYLTLTYGQRRPFEQGKPVLVGDREIVEPVDFALPKMSVITGRVVNDVGEPVEGARVLAMRWTYVNGEKRFVPTGRGVNFTDDAGAYRLTGLIPGSYIVMAQASEQWTVDVGDRRESMGYSPTYFPGTDAAQEARKITVGLGKEAPGVDFALIPGRAANVSGTAFDSHGQIFKTVGLRDEVRGEGFGGFFGGSGEATVAPDGTFSFSNVSPGEYKLTASTGPAGNGSTPEVSIVPIVVAGIDLTNLSLLGSTGGSISGQVRTDDGPLPRNIELQIAQRLLGQPDPTILGVFRDSSGRGQVKDDGTFDVKNVFGPARFDVTLPEDWAVKGIFRDGQDITDTALAPRSGEEWPGVQIVLTNRPTVVTGQLRDDKGRPAADGTLIVFSADSRRWFDRSRFVRAARPDQQGRAQIKGLPPGEYLTTAVDYVEDAMWYDPDYLESLREGSRKLTLADGGAQTVSLTVIAR